MNNKVIVSFLPDYSNANNFISKIDFADSYKIESLKDEEIKEIYLKLLSNNSTLIKSLMSFRNKIMSLFGFKTEIKYSNNIKDIQVGNKVGFFTIYYIDEHEIIAGEKDTDLTVTTLVQYNNFFGKVYMTFVKPFHKIVVKNMLKNLR